MYVGNRPALCTERNNVPTPCAHVTALTGRSTAHPSAFQRECRFITFALWNSPRFLSIQRVVEISFFLRLIFLKATARIAFLNTKRHASAHYFCSWRQDMFFSLWVNVPDLRSFFLRGKPWWQFKSGAAEHPEERWGPPINHTSSRFSKGYRRISNTQFRWRLSVVIFSRN